MKNLITIFGLTSLFLFTGCLNDDEPSTAIVNGIVTDAFSGDRIQGADVSISGLISEQTQTGSSGEFRFSSLPAGEYEIHVTSPGYDPNSQSVTLRAGDVRSVDLTLSQGGSNTVGNDCFSINNQNLNFGLTLNEMQVSITNLKGLAQTLTFDSASYPWIVLSPSSSQTIQPGGTAVWTVKIDRSQITSSVNATIPVNTASNSGNCTGFTINVNVQI